MPSKASGRRGRRGQRRRTESARARAPRPMGEGWAGPARGVSSVSSWVASMDPLDAPNRPRPRHGRFAGHGASFRGPERRGSPPHTARQPAMRAITAIADAK